MKKIYLAIALMLPALGAGAQDMYYAWMLSQNNYYGTARTTALGNAVTALGGDTGMITVNPAASAVAGYSQITLTPGLVISSTSTAFSPDGSDAGLGNPYSLKHGRVILPNVALSFTAETGRRTGVVAYSFGLMSNTTNVFDSYSTGLGTNPYTSFLGSLAAGAKGMSSFSAYSSLYAAFNANQFGEYGHTGSRIFAGSNERIDPSDTYSYVPAPLKQTAIYNNYGSKYDFVFNFGMNISDKLFLGVNLGLPMVKYRRYEYFHESIGDNPPELFPVIFEYGKSGATTKVQTYYLSSSDAYRLNTNVTGIYGRFGFIYTPASGFRIGAAIQTPSVFKVKEEWQYSAATSFADSRFDGSAKSYSDSFSYRLRTPYVFTAGIASALGSAVLLSVDYELTDYSVMRYGDRNTDFDNNGWMETNDCIRTFLGVSHSVRAGLEVKPIPSLALRCGYSFISDPEKFYRDDIDNVVTASNWKGMHQLLLSDGHFNRCTHGFSLGVGYSSPGAFFADFAARFTKYPESWYSPYWYGSYDAVDADAVPVPALAPIERIERNTVDLILTLGLRF